MTTPETTVRGEIALLARVGAPIALAQFGLVGMGLVDLAILGWESPVQQAGAGLGRTLGFTAMFVGLGLASALEPLAAQALGANEPARAWAAFRTTMLETARIAPVLLGAAYLATYLPFGIDRAQLAAARDFLLGNAPGFALFMLFVVGKTFLQTHGATRPALVASAVANVVNLVACNLLVRGDHALVAIGLRPVGLVPLGAFGAGLAASLGGIVLAGITLHGTWRYRCNAPGVTVSAKRVRALGIPAGAQMLAEAGAFSLVTLLAGRLGTPVAAAHQIALQLASFTFMGALGVSGATAARVGHRIGAGESARRSGAIGIALGAAVMLPCAIVFAIVPGALVSVFTVDPGVRATSIALVRIAALFQLFDGVQVVAAGALRGAGDVRVPFVANAFAHWCVGLPLAIVLGFVVHAGAVGLWWGLTAGLVTVSTALTLRFVVVTRRSIARVA